MNRIQRWAVVGLGAVLAAALLSGCADQGPVRPAGLEEKIASARSPSDHEEIASLFEQQAGLDKAAALQHRSLARIYTRSGGARGAPNPAMSSHCDKLAQTYQQAADENLVLAKMHRQMAVEAK